MRTLSSAARRALVAGLAVAALAVATSDARASCSDGVQNGAETGVDCGGACLACNGDACASNGDCTSGSCVDSICAVVFSVDTSQGATAAQPGGTAVAVDPSLTIAGGGTIAGARVLIAGGLVTGEDTLGFTAQSGISGSYNSSTGVLTLSGAASVSTYEAALRTVTYRNSNGASPSTADRVVTFALGDKGLPFAGTGHFYEYVGGTMTWQNARNAAAARRYFGLTGYLVTVTSGGENAFVAAKLSGQGWMGAGDAAAANVWRWMTGPEGLEAGGQGRYFFAQSGGGGSPTVGLRVDQAGSSCTQPSDCESGVCTSGTCYNYANWNSGEPNNYGAGEQYGHFLTNGLWNDYAYNNGAINGYVVEYGGMPDDPPLVLQDNKTVRIVSVSCSNSVQDGDETAVDCGGSCGPCATGQGCLVDGDCTSFVCSGGVCQAPSCDDDVRNGSETDVDCGGSCLADCADGEGCNSNGDCQSGKCTTNVCQAPTCDDSVVNNGETDVDCGGPNCGACTNGNSCLAPSDCVSGICSGGVCQSASCTDLALNGDETDVDCGGASCSACLDGLACLVANDCQSRVCDGGFCQPATCSDGVRNDDETDVDCGGSCPGACVDGGGCDTGDDCASGVCANDVCQAPTCGDGVMNAAETGVDCGGGTCGPCAGGGGCVGPSDCVSLICDGGTCTTASCEDGVLNSDEVDVDCGGSCPLCPLGAGCGVAADCATDLCDGGVCACPPDTVWSAASQQCLAAGECGALMSCELGVTPIVFYAIVSDVDGPVGSVRCVRAATGGVTCDADANGELIVSDELWCQP